MATFRDSVLAGLSAVDGVMGILDLSPSRIDVVTRRWSLGEKNRGTPGDSVTPLPDWVTYRIVTQLEIADSGGRYRKGDLMVGPLRPYWVQNLGIQPYPGSGPVIGSADGSAVIGASGGFRRSDLDPRVDDDGTEVFYRVRQRHEDGTGENGDYELVALISDDPLEWSVVLRRMTSPTDAPQASDDLPPGENPLTGSR